MKINHLILTIILFISLGVSGVQAQNRQNALNDLEKTFTAFKYKEVLKKGRFYLGEPYTQRQDSLAIYTYMLNAAYALHDTTQARQYITSILKINPTYRMSPETTSPKIIELFETVKKQQPVFPRNTPNHFNNKPDTVFTTRGLTPGQIFSTIVLPGSGHWLAGDKESAYFHGGISILLMTAGIYSIYHTQQTEKAYLEETIATQMENRYKTYNTAYKWRNTLITAYLAWGIYNILDLSHKIPRLNVQATQRRLALQLSVPIH